MSINTSVQIPEPLSGRFKSSFAYKTLTDRLPVIITKVIDYICRQRKQLPQKLVSDKCNFDAAEEETKNLIDELARLKYELQTNKPFTLLESNLSDTSVWNNCLNQEHRDQETIWFNVSWLYAECYFYRRMREVFVQSTYFKCFDQFESIKQESFIISEKVATKLATNLNNVKVQFNSQSMKELFNFYTMASLYGNKSDLSISCGEQSGPDSAESKSLDSKILVNDFDYLWNYVNKISGAKSHYRIDIVLDNAGFELFTDLVMIEFYHQANLFPKENTMVYLHVKKMPWFVSDTMAKDIYWMLEEVKQNSIFSNDLKIINEKFNENIKKGTWIVEESDFWTLPYDFSKMSTYAPELYQNLSKSDLIIFKGDLNYRKLVGDLNWPFTTTFKDSLREFQPPTALCSLRTIKADVVVGIHDSSIIDQIKTKFADNWMETGDYAVIQFLNNN